VADNKEDKAAPQRRKISILGRDFHLPQSRGLRISIGIVLIFGGILGFLPILGFWMIPLGFLVLSQDIPAVRRQRRKISLWWGRRQQSRKP
jgi:hypothetical protein